MLSGTRDGFWATPPPSRQHGHGASNRSRLMRGRGANAGGTLAGSEAQVGTVGMEQGRGATARGSGPAANEGGNGATAGLCRIGFWGGQPHAR